jgi:hypothetical protein
MARKEEVSKHLPHFYRYWDRVSALSMILAGVGTVLDETEKDLVSIMKSHWVDTAHAHDLDQIGGLYGLSRRPGETDPELRNRLKRAILSYKGGGTIGAVQMVVRMLLRLPPDYPVTIIENPERTMKKTMQVRANQEMVMNSRSIVDSVPRITFEIETPDTLATDPTFMNITTGQTVTYKGQVSSGDILVLSGDTSTLNGTDVSGSTVYDGFPDLPRRRSTWKYSERTGGNVGIFDRTTFDESVFAIDIIARVTIEWKAREPAAFEVRIEKELLDTAGLSKFDLLEGLNAIKACGVKAYVQVVEQA